MNFVGSIEDLVGPLSELNSEDTLSFTSFLDNPSDDCHRIPSNVISQHALVSEVDSSVPVNYIQNSAILNCDSPAITTLKSNDVASGSVFPVVDTYASPKRPRLSALSISSESCRSSSSSDIGLVVRSPSSITKSQAIRNIKYYAESSHLNPLDELSTNRNSISHSKRILDIDNISVKEQVNLEAFKKKMNLGVESEETLTDKQNNCTQMNILNDSVEVSECPDYNLKVASNDQSDNSVLESLLALPLNSLVLKVNDSLQNIQKLSESYADLKESLICISALISKQSNLLLTESAKCVNLERNLASCHAKQESYRSLAYSLRQELQSSYTLVSNLQKQQQLSQPIPHINSGANLNLLGLSNNSQSGSNYKNRIRRLSTSSPNANVVHNRTSSSSTRLSQQSGNTSAFVGNTVHKPFIRLQPSNQNAASRIINLKDRLPSDQEFEDKHLNSKCVSPFVAENERQLVPPLNLAMTKFVSASLLASQDMDSSMNVKSTSSHNKMALPNDNDKSVDDNVYSESDLPLSNRLPFTPSEVPSIFTQHVQAAQEALVQARAKLASVRSARLSCLKTSKKNEYVNAAVLSATNTSRTGTPPHCSPMARTERKLREAVAALNAARNKSGEHFDRDCGARLVQHGVKLLSDAQNDLSNSSSQYRRTTYENPNL